MLSNRVKRMQSSPIRKLAKYAVEAKKRGIEVYHLNIGQPDIETPDVVWDSMESYKDRVLAYGPSDGLPELKDEVAKYLKRYNIEVSSDDVFITSGGSEAIYFAFMSVMENNESVLIPEPFYTNYNGFAAMAGVNIKPIPTSVENGFHLPQRDEIESLITDDVKAILICSPNNPTGTIYTKEEMDMIVDIVKKHNLFLIGDEVYREFVFTENKPISVLSYKEIEDRAIMVDSISKRFSACGARIGYLVTRNKEIMEGVLKLGQARLCPPTLEQIGAIAAYQHFDEIIPPMIDEYKRRRDVVYNSLKDVEGVFISYPEGAFYTVVKIPHNAEKFSVFMLNDFNVNNKTVMVAPAGGFYATEGKGENEIRIAYVLKEEKLKEAMEILIKGIEAFNG